MYIDLVTINLCPGQGGGGVKPSGTLDISENGVYDVYKYSSASVDVHPSASLSETYISNGSYNITGEFNGGVITVDVPASQFVTEPLNVSANGTYNPGQGVDGYSQVVVDVPISGWDQKSVTEGTIEIINLDNSASFVASEAFTANKTIQTVNLPYVTKVYNSAFYNCFSLTQVSLPMCSFIGYRAFYNCTSLSQVSLPMCSYIGAYALAYCSSLTQVNIPVCTVIDEYAFNSCNSLSQIDLPMCSYISDDAFWYCSSLLQISLPVCKYINHSAFAICSSLSQIDLPMCSFISDDAFWYCSSLLQISLPMCSYIGTSVFYYCILLSQISLPMCSFIGYQAFYDCSSLSIITIGYSSVCSLIGSAVFTNTQITSSTGSIYVPTSLVDSYKSAKHWSYFSTQIFPIPE